MYIIDTDKIFHKNIIYATNQNRININYQSTPQFEPSQGQFHVLVSATKTRAMQRYIQCMYVR